jgi:hypothetical protein
VKVKRVAKEDVTVGSYDVNGIVKAKRVAKEDVTVSAAMPTARLAS